MFHKTTVLLHGIKWFPISYCPANCISLHDYYCVFMRKVRKILLLSAMLLGFSITGCHTTVSNPEAARVIGILNKEMFKDPKRALALLDSVERAGVFPPAEANILRVNVYWNSGQKRLAAFYGEQALADAGLKREGEAYYSAINVMAKWYSENGEYGKASEMSDWILSDMEGDSSPAALTMRSSALTRKAECEIHTGHPDEAERLYHESIGILMDGMTHPKDYWEIDPLFYSILELSDFYLEKGQADKALALMPVGDTALARLGRCPGVPEYVLRFRRNNVTISQAMVYAAAGQSDKAEALYLQHRKSDNLSHTDILVEGRYLAMTGRYDEAVRLYRRSDSLYRAIGGPVTNAYVNSRMALQYDALQKAGRITEALALGDRMRELTDSIRVQERLADIQQQQLIRQKEEEIIKRRQSLMVLLIVLIAALLICILIACLLWRSHIFNKELSAKNRKLYEEIEQRRQAQQQEMAQLKAAPMEQLTTEQQLYRRLCSLMEEKKLYTDESMNRETLAQMLGTNEKYVEQAIRQCSKGETVGEFINRYRMENVARLLKTTDEPISIIGEVSGIPSRSTLARLFRNAYGMTPTEYRKI